MRQSSKSGATPRGEVARGRVILPSRGYRYDDPMSDLLVRGRLTSPRPRCDGLVGALPAGSQVPISISEAVAWQGLTVSLAHAVSSFPHPLVSLSGQRRFPPHAIHLPAPRARTGTHTHSISLGGFTCLQSAGSLHRLPYWAPKREIPPTLPLLFTYTIIPTAPPLGNPTAPWDLA